VSEMVVPIASTGDSRRRSMPSAGLWIILGEGVPAA
jgi:hypothetical protein